MNRDDGRRCEMAVLDVHDFNSPGSDGHWPCIVCGETFAVSDSWQIRLEDSGAVVTCPRCADHARRNGTVTIPADRSMRFDHSWAADPGDSAQVG